MKVQGLYEARRMTDGKFVCGNLIHVPGSPFAYIATMDAVSNCIVDEIGGGLTTGLVLTRVLESTISPICASDWYVTHA